MKKKTIILISLLMAAALVAFTGCGGSGSSSETEEATSVTEETSEAEEPTEAEKTSEAEAPDGDASLYGYTGEDPAEAACYRYMVEEIAPQYTLNEGSVSVPAIVFVDTKDGEDGQTDIYGDFWIYNYDVSGDTLKMISGGDHPGVMHVEKDGDTWRVTGFDQVTDGDDFESSAREIFGDEYDAFMKINSDSDAIDKARAQTLADYVKANGLKVTKYKDEGWAEVDLPL